MPGFYLRGALIELKPAFLVPVPNVIIFQYNPETMVSSWSNSGGQKNAAGQSEGSALGVGGDPGQDFSFTISMDAHDTVADTNDFRSDLAEIHGIYPRIAALETLLFSNSSSGKGAGLATGAGGACGGKSSLPGVAAKVGTQRKVPTSTLPPVLFVWGPGRILPVRLTSLRVTEKLFDKFLVPTQAQAEIGLRVLTGSDIDTIESAVVKGILQTAYHTMKTLRQTLAIENSLEPAVDLYHLLKG